MDLGFIFTDNMPYAMCQNGRIHYDKKIAFSLRKLRKNHGLDTRNNCRSTVNMHRPLR